MSHSASADEKSDEIDLTGRQLGDYRLLRRLGRGAMAEVYLGEQGSLRRQVALKVLRPGLATDENYVRRFHLEAQAAASLIQANIVQIHEVGCIDGFHYIAQEYVQGQNLRELLQRHGLPDLKLAISIIRQVAAALAKAADQGIVHRDIKPENIMITRRAEVKVADFGLARLTNGGDALTLTQAGITMGTPLYMSPEQVEGRPLDPRSDIYSLGVTTYHMLSGKPPFNGDTALAVAMHHLRTQPERLENSRTDLPTPLCRIVHRMLAKDPAQRYQHPREIIREIRELRVEDDDADWDSLFDGGENLVYPEAGQEVAATAQLSQLMQTQTLLVSNQTWIRYMWIGVLIACTGGALLAYWMREPFLLADSAVQNVVPLKATAEEQYQYALITGSNPDAWQAVVDHPAKNEKWSHLAQKQLASIYLQNAQYDLALEQFEDLANLNASESSYRAFGLAGQCVVFAIKEEEAQLNDALARFAALTGSMDAKTASSLLDRHMIDLMEVILAKKQQKEQLTTSRATEELIKILDNAAGQKQ